MQFQNKVWGGGGVGREMWTRVSAESGMFVLSMCESN